MSYDDTISDYKKHPALAAYIDRIGAIQVSFNRFLIRISVGKYFDDRVRIKVGHDGTVKCSDDEYAPTDEEAKAIKDESPAYKWPTSVVGSRAGALSDIEKFIRASKWPWIAENLYLLPEEHDRDAIVMAQYRVNKADGSKAYLPFCSLSNGKWAMQEPDRDHLPFWKPARRHNLARIMVHEGSKAARAMDELVNGIGFDADDRRAQHKWVQTLSGYEHWGMIGGALSGPHRADYNELRKLGLQEVVYSADNDEPGLSNIQTISRNYGRKMQAIKFHSDFPDGWDMGDELPKPDVKRESDNIEDLRMYMRPATWATERVEQEGPGRPVYRLTNDFKREWYWIIEPEVFVHAQRPGWILSAKAFNNLVKPFALPVEDVVRLMTRIEERQVDKLKFDPSRPPGIYMEDNFSCFNSHRPSSIVPTRGDPAPFLDYLNRLIVFKEDRFELMRWLATLIARPEIHMSYGVLLISEMQGVGKSTLGAKILAPILGRHNCSFPTEGQIMGAHFNEWAAHYRLAIIEEVYSGADSNKLYNEFKAYLTNDDISVEIKHRSPYGIKNFLHILANSNSVNAIKIAPKDRRWFIPEVSEELQSHDYWKGFHSWLTKGGLSIIRYWANDWLRDNPWVLKGEHAPDSKYKHNIIDESYSRGQLVARDRIMRFLETDTGKQPWIVMDEVIGEVVKDVLFGGYHTERMERVSTLNKAIREIPGVWIGKDRIGFGGIYGRVISNQKGLTVLSNYELLQRGQFRILKVADFKAF